MRKSILLIIFTVFAGYILVAQQVLLPDTIRICKADSVMLDAGAGFDTYLWSTGQSSQSIWVMNIGDYSVNVTSGDTVDITEDVYFINIPAEIVQIDTSIYCGDTIMLSIDSSGFTSLWMPEPVISDTVFVWPRDTTMFYAAISQLDTAYHYCIDSVQVIVEPQITVDTLIQLTMGCPGEEVAQVKVTALGDYEPLDYDWSAGFKDIYEPEKAGGLMEGDYFVMVSDTLGCELRHDFSVEAYGMPDVELSTDKIDDDGNTVVYLQNPSVTFYFENPLYDSLGADTFQINSWTWDFGDESTSILMEPTHNYKESGTFNVNFDFITFYNCEDTDSIKVEVKPVKLNVPNVITPNGDGVNENFVIDIEDGGGEEGSGGTFKSSGDIPDLNEYYLSNTLLIFNRWGQELYKIDNYKNDWDGENLVDGVYFYIFKCHGQYRDDVYKGSLTILRKKF